jgi:hypothetical protein
MHALVATLASVVSTAAAAPPPPPVLSSRRIGAITADCRDPKRVTLTFRTYRWTPGEGVTVQAGGRTARRSLWAGRRLRITVPYVRHPLGRDRAWYVTPVVRWRVFQTHEPDETRALAKVRMEQTYGCLPVVADLRLRTKPH